MADFLLEIFTEEIPSRMQKGACDYMRTHAENTLRDKKLSFSDLNAYVTPRRLVLHVKGLPLKGEDYLEERKGPSRDAPLAAIQGFLKSAGVTLEDCTHQDMGKKGIFLCATIAHKGEDTAYTLSTFIDSLIKTFPWPKSMTWGDAPLLWIRPIRAILALFDGKVVPYQLPGHAVASGHQTQGHRFLAPHHFKVQSFEDYALQLRQNYVILDSQERLKLIQENSQKLAETKGLKVKFDSKLLEELCGLVEWPVPLMGQIDQKFMDLPPEVLITSMKVHQRYLSLEDRTGKIAPHFIMIANMETVDQGHQIIQGNERILRARLSDASFFWDTDRNKPLQEWGIGLESQIFHAKLGTMAEKVARLEQLGETLVSEEAEKFLVRSAARLCKADLMTGMVGEFPELQGIMGGYYALQEGLDPQVATAIRDHYKPAGPNDALPQGPISQALALADKIDSLVGFFAIGIEPTSSKDPYALRRHALGIIRIILENKVSLELMPMLEKAYHCLQAEKRSLEETMKALNIFLAERLRGYLKAAGYPHDHVAALLGETLESGNLLHILLKLQAFSEFLTTSQGESLLLTYKRGANILKEFEVKNKLKMDSDLDISILIEDSEKVLYKSLLKINNDLDSYLNPTQPDFKGSMKLIETLRQPLDHFFEKVMVQSEDARLTHNRLRLLALLRQTFHKIANFGALV